MTLMSNSHLTEVLQPSKEAFHLPPALVSSELAAILGLRFTSITPVRSNHLDAHLLQLGVKWVGVISFVSHEPLRSAANMGCLESVLHKGDFMWSSTFNVYGEWKRRVVCNDHDLRTFA